jgi:hypothetical protein
MTEIKSLTDSILLYIPEEHFLLLEIKNSFDLEMPYLRAIALGYILRYEFPKACNTLAKKAISLHSQEDIKYILGCLFSDSENLLSEVELLENTYEKESDLWFLELEDCKITRNNIENVIAFLAEVNEDHSLRSNLETVDKRFKKLLKNIPKQPYMFPVQLTDKWWE